MRASEERALEHLPIGAGHGARDINGWGMAGAWSPRRQFIGHLVCSNRLALDPIFGIFHLDSDLGAYTKVVAL